jgi:hypothetical protein
MKSLIFIVLFFCAKNVVGQTYYFSNAGNDANSGLTTGLPKASIIEANTISGTSGRTILFNRGDIWYGTLVVGSSSTTYGAYGTGAKPIITGFTTITGGWTNEGSGIYSKVIPAALKTNIVTIDGVQYGIGRTPNTGWLTVTAYTNNTSVTVAGIGSATNWTGASLSSKHLDYLISRNKITAHSGDVFTVVAGGNPTGFEAVGYGTSIVDDIRTLDTYGEWYHDFTGTGRIYMYFGGVEPTTKVLNVATLDKLFTCAAFNSAQVNNINFTGAIGKAIVFSNTSNSHVVDNCIVNFAGDVGVTMVNGVTNSQITYNTITNCNTRAITSDCTDINHLIFNNTVSDVAQIDGQSLANITLDGIYYGAGTCSFNNIQRIGYNGIIARNLGNTITEYNFISDCQNRLNDGGGIYVGGPSAFSRIIRNNIILNTNPLVLNGSTRSSALTGGIYIDEEANNVIVYDNAISTCTVTGAAGIKMNKIKTCTIRNNLIYNADWGFYCANNSVDNNGDDPALNLTGNIITKNTIICRTSGQVVVKWRNNYTSAMNLNTLDSNSWQRPIAVTNIFDITTTPAVAGGNGGHNFSGTNGWQSLTGQEANGSVHPKTITSTSELFFLHNYSASPLVYNFTGFKKMLPDGSTANNSYSIPAYSGQVFYDNGTATSTPAGASFPNRWKN